MRQSKTFFHSFSDIKISNTSFSIFSNFSSSTISACPRLVLGTILSESRVFLKVSKSEIDLWGTPHWGIQCFRKNRRRVHHTSQCFTVFFFIFVLFFGNFRKKIGKTTRWAPSSNCSGQPRCGSLWSHVELCVH